MDDARDREKTECGVFESAIGCTLDTAYRDMRANKERWGRMDGVQGYHLVQSFAEGELTPELAHRIGLELAEKTSARPISGRRCDASQYTLPAQPYRMGFGGDGHRPEIPQQRQNLLYRGAR